MSIIWKTRHYSTIFTTSYQIYHTTMEQARILTLTSAEQESLNKKILGYGKLTEAAQKTGLHVNTIRLIGLKGSGTPESIEIIRTKLLIEENAEESTVVGATK